MITAQLPFDDCFNPDFLRGYSEGYKTAMLEIQQRCESRYRQTGLATDTATTEENPK